MLNWFTIAITRLAIKAAIKIVDKVLYTGTLNTIVHYANKKIDIPVIDETEEAHLLRTTIISSLTTTKELLGLIAKYHNAQKNGYVHK